MKTDILTTPYTDPTFMQPAAVARKASTPQQAQKVARELTAQFLEVFIKQIMGKEGSTLFGDGHAAETFIKPQFISAVSQACAHTHNGCGFYDMMYKAVLKSSNLTDTSRGATYDHTL